MRGFFHLKLSVNITISSANALQMNAFQSSFQTRYYALALPRASSRLKTLDVSEACNEHVRLTKQKRESVKSAWLFIAC